MELMSVSMRVILSPNAPQPLGAYSQAIRAGSLLFLAGQIPIEPATGELVSGDIVRELECIIRNLSAVLSAAGGSLQNVVKTTVYLTSMADLTDVNAGYARHFGGAAPARTTVAVAALPRGVRIEIDAIAVLA